MRIFLVIFFVLLCLVGGSFLWLQWELNTPYYAASAEETFIEIPKGAGTGLIADLLQKSGIIHRSLPLRLYIRWYGMDRHLLAGEYRFATPATPPQIIERIVRGDVYYRVLTIPEGLTSFETIELINRAGLGNLQDLAKTVFRIDWIRDIDPAAKTLEGYLFPETYRFPRKVTPEDIIKTMVDQFHVRYSRLLAEFPKERARDARSIVTLASMVEKEASSPQERALVASVLTNRLEKEMPLACDPTIIYALKLARKFDGNIRKTDLAIRSPYNTYTHSGLPPGPIANPGEESLRAAISPARTGYFFFVSRNDGTHQFSRDFRSHAAAVARFQRSLSH